MIRRVTTAVTLFLALGLGVFLASPAFAYGPIAATITLSATTVAPGGTITVTGVGFAPNTTITITLHSDPVTLATTPTVTTGGFMQTVTIPSNTTPGTHTLVVTDGVGDTASATITVVSPSVAVSPTPPAAPPTTTVPTVSPSLAVTGADIGGLSALGAGVVVVGGLLVLSSRKRRRNSLD